MHDILVILVHLIVTVVRLIKPGGLRAVVAESAFTRHQLLILNRSRKRAPNLRIPDRIIAGLCTLLMYPSRLLFESRREAANLNMRLPTASPRSELRVPRIQANRFFEVNEVKLDEARWAKL